MKSVRPWSREAGAFGWLLGADVLARVGGQGAMLVTARVLGPRGFGIVAVSWALLSVLIVIADLGVGEAAIQRLTPLRGGRQTFHDTVAPLRMALGVPYSVAGVALLLATDSDLGRSCALTLLVTPLALLVGGQALADRIDGRFRSASGWSATLLLSQWAGAAAGAVVMGTPVGATLGYVVLVALTGAAAFVVSPLRRPRLVPGWVPSGRPFLVTSAAVVLYSRGDRLLVGALLGAAAAGAYSAAYSVVMIAALAGGAAHSAVLPRLLGPETISVPVLLRRCGVLALALLVPAAALAASAPTIVSVLYGGDFAAATDILRLLTPLVVLYVTNPLLSSLLIAQGRQHDLAAVAVLNLLLAAVAYPLAIRGWGVSGAAGASVLVEAFGSVAMISRLWRRGVPSAVGIRQSG